MSFRSFTDEFGEFLEKHEAVKDIRSVNECDNNVKRSFVNLDFQKIP